MKYGLAAFLSVSLLLTACSKKEQKESEEQSPTPVAKDVKKSDTSALHIEPTMLRDLRITTAVVERRSGGESMAFTTPAMV